MGEINVQEYDCVHLQNTGGEKKNTQSCHDDPSSIKLYFILVLFGHLS